MKAAQDSTRSSRCQQATPVLLRILQDVPVRHTGSWVLLLRNTTALIKVFASRIIFSISSISITLPPLYRGSMRWFATFMKLLFEQYKHLKLQPLKKITDTDLPYQSIVDIGNHYAAKDHFHLVSFIKKIIS